jgi:hypothetical protein
MVDDNAVSRDQVQKLIAVANFELRSFGRLGNEMDHPQITQIFLKESA